MDIEQHYENLRSQGKLAEAKQFRIVSTRAMQDDQKKRMQALKDFYKALLSWGCGCCEKQLGCKIKENADVQWKEGIITLAVTGLMRCQDLRKRAIGE